MGKSHRHIQEEKRIRAVKNSVKKDRKVARVRIWDKIEETEAYELSTTEGREIHRESIR